MTEACETFIGPALLQIFVMILIQNQPSHPHILYSSFRSKLSEHIRLSQPQWTAEEVDNRLRCDIEELLQREGASLHDVVYDGIDYPDISAAEHMDIINREFSKYNPEEESQKFRNKWRIANPEQKDAVNTIMNSLQETDNKLFFLDGPAGTGKSFTQSMLLHKIRADRKVPIVCATSGIAATILEGGRTIHSTFKMPLNIHAESCSAMNCHSDDANLIAASCIIIIDESVMAHKYLLEGVDRLIRDIQSSRHSPHCDDPFGGKTVLFSGDFRQLLPVVRSGGRAEMIQSSLLLISFWSHVRVLSLTRNMRLQSADEGEEFSLSTRKKKWH